MATWIIAGACVVAALIVLGAVLVVLLFTRGEDDDDIPLPRFKRFGLRDAGAGATSPDDD